MMKASATTNETLESQVTQCVLVDSWRWIVPRKRRTKINLTARSRGGQRRREPTRQPLRSIEQHETVDTHESR
jgi:hypothetical protein